MQCVVINYTSGLGDLVNSNPKLENKEKYFNNYEKNSKVNKAYFNSCFFQQSERSEIYTFMCIPSPSVFKCQRL